MSTVKTVALFEDLSGIGRCALSVAIPIISVLGSQACPVPTALLSAHTLFGGVTPSDMTDFVSKAVCEWDKMGRKFDCALTGYMPSPNCVEAVAPFVERQKLSGCKTIVDPAMADDGKLYRSLDPAIVASYRNLCRHAFVITPNATEARLLSNRDGDVDSVMDALLALGCESAVITGWQISPKLFANAYKPRGGQLRLCEYVPLPARFPGTGDILAACLAGYVNRGLEMFDALKRATAFVRTAMEITIAQNTDPREGVLFEKALDRL